MQAEAKRHRDSMPARRVADESLVDQLVSESNAMASYALASGLRVPHSLLEGLERLTSLSTSDGGWRRDEQWNKRFVGDLAHIHERLTALVAPASPRTLLLLQTGSQERLSFLGPIRIVRHFMITAAFLLVIFMVVPLSPYVSHDSGDIFESQGVELLLNEIFFMAAAGVGAAFSALFRVNRYITKGTYDPKYESSYWIRFVLGIIAGMVMAELLPAEESFSRPLLALLGGFSADVVYQVLSRLVQTLESVVADGSAEEASADSAWRTRENARVEQERASIATRLVALKIQIDKGDLEGSTTVVRGLLDELLPGEAITDDAAAGLGPSVDWSSRASAIGNDGDSAAEIHGPRDETHRDR